MIIVKHGKPKKEPKFYFICPDCGCEFILTQLELREKCQSLVYTALSSCPECGELDIRGEIMDE